MFKIGDSVVYRSEGVCVVSDIRSESFGGIGKSEEYYILTPVNDKKSTVFVPVNNERLTSMMRRLLNADELSTVIDGLRDERIEWVSDSRARSNVFREMLSSGDRRQLIILLNTVSERVDALREAGKKVGSTEANAYMKAERLLYEEFAATTDIQSQEKVVAVLRGEIRLRDKKEL